MFGQQPQGGVVDFGGVAPLPAQDGGFVHPGQGPYLGQGFPCAQAAGAQAFGREVVAFQRIHEHSPFG